jgi:hypothetical protein
MVQQVTLASLTTPMERNKGLYSVPKNRMDTLGKELLAAVCEGKVGTEMITIPERIADGICDEKECAFIGKHIQLC